MSTTRREFLRRTSAGLAALGAGALVDNCGGGSSSGTPSTPTGNPLRSPVIFSGGSLTAAPTTINMFPDRPATQVLALNGLLPSPTIRLRRGQGIGLNFANGLAESSIIHWHGVLNPPDQDGHPRDQIGPGAVYPYSFDIDQRAGTYWYHPHPHGLTARQVYLGMAGFFIIEDPEELSIGLPADEREVSLLLSDRRVAADGSLVYAPTAVDHPVGWLGDRVLVNHTPDAFLEVSQSLYRFRILNGSNARVYRLGFDSGKPFFVIGTDAGLLERPSTVQSIYLSPAERADILVDFSNQKIGDNLNLRSLAFSVPGAAAPSGGVPAQGADLQVMRFSVSRAGTGPNVPPLLSRTLEHLDPNDADNFRVFNLTGDQLGELHSFTINGQVFDVNRIDEQVPFGSVEVWEINNATNGIHPMHSHGALFQVLSRNARPLAPEEGGWKDTVMTWPGETVRIIIRFDHHQGVYLFHCHNLEHEDAGMMINVEVV